MRACVCACVCVCVCENICVAYTCVFLNYFVRQCRLAALLVETSQYAVRDCCMIVELSKVDCKFLYNFDSKFFSKSQEALVKGDVVLIIGNFSILNCSVLFCVHFCNHCLFIYFTVDYVSLVH